jgi:hypothetical protein
MSQQQQQQALQQLDQVQVAQINRELNNGRITREQFAQARRIIVGLLAAGLAIETINNVFPGALGLFLINMVNTAWQMSSQGVAILASTARDQLTDSSRFMVRNLLQLVTASMGAACDIYSGLTQYVTMSNARWLLSFIVGTAAIRGANDIQQYGTSFINGDRDDEAIDQLYTVRDGLAATGSTAAEWSTGFEEATASMEQKPVQEGLFSRRPFLTDVDESLAKALSDALYDEFITDPTMSGSAAIAALWDLRDTDPDEFERLSPRLKFLYLVLHGIERISDLRRNRLGSYSVPGSPDERMLQQVDPDHRPDERMAPLYASVPTEVEGRFPEYGSRVRARQCHLTEEEERDAIEAVTDMVSGRQFDPNNSETYDLITKNAFLRVIMMEPFRKNRSGNIYTEFMRLHPSDQTNIIAGMYNFLPPDVNIERALIDENIEAWADNFRKIINARNEPARTREDRSSDSDRSDEETGSKINKTQTSALSRQYSRGMPPTAFRSAASPVSAANAPYPDNESPSGLFTMTREQFEEDERGGRKTHKRRNNRRRATRKGRKAKRQTKRRKGAKRRKGRRQTKRR